LISTSRGFLPWRLSDDGPGASGNVATGPSSETLHINGLLRCTTGSEKLISRAMSVADLKWKSIEDHAVLLTSQKRGTGACARHNAAVHSQRRVDDMIDDQPVELACNPLLKPLQ